MLNLFLLLIGILLFVDVEAQSYQQRIQEFLEHNFNYNQVGLVVHSLTDNKILYQHHNNKLFVPASLVKLFTLASSLEELTSNFKFVTKLTWNKNKLINHTLHGDLGLIFSGDPEFTQKNLEKLILAIKKQGINQIEGDFIVDDTLYSEDYAPGWVIDDLTWGYAAPSTAIVIDENKISIKVNPIYTFGQQVNFAISNDYNNYNYENNSNKNNNYSSLIPFNIESKVLAVNHLQAANDCRLKVKLNANNDIWFSGCVEIEPKDQLINLAVNSPRKYLQDLLKIYLNKYNINLIGTIIFKQAPPNLVELKVHESSKLSNLLSVMMKNSNNIYANNIGKALGVKLYGHGSFLNATNAIKNILHKKFTINTSTLNILDSSGLSIYNVATPNHFVRLLQAIYNDKNLYNMINKIFPKPGTNGTLKNRLTAKDLRFKLWAKTGSLKHSSGLAGFIRTKNNQELAFVFIINNLLTNDFMIKQLTDELCELLINYG